MKRVLARRGLVLVHVTVLLVGLVALIAATPLPRALGEAWALNAPPRRADAIVVLGGGVRWPGYLPCGSLYRLQHGVRLYRQGYAPRLILTGGGDPRHPAVPSEAIAMRDTALELGVKPQDIVLETQATRTYENGVKVAHVMREHTWRSAIIVTDALHMRRAYLVFHRLGIDAYPSAGRTMALEGGGPSQGLLILERLAHEIIGLTMYRLRGWA
jgi:uncharacterized SAM-binding protein YcdF (DUF218 family)